MISDQKELATKFVNSWGEDGTVGVRMSYVAAYLESLNGLLGAACDIINSDDSALGTTTSTVALGMGFCSGTKVGVSLSKHLNKVIIAIYGHRRFEITNMI